MTIYPDYVTKLSRRIAERFYRRLPHLHIPTGYDLDDLADRDDTSGGFTVAAHPERTDND